MVAEVTLEGKGYSKGRCPVSRFPWMEKCVKLFKFSTHRGNSPDSWLFPSNNLCRLAVFPSWGGIGPVSPLLWSRSCVRLESCPSADGIGPVSPLPWSSSCVRLESCPSSDGIDPVSLLPWRISSLRLDKLPSSGGIDPVRLLSAMARVSSSRRFPSSGGRVPFSGGESGPGIHNDMTRCGIPDSVVDTVVFCQLPIAVVEFQLRVPVPRRVSFSPQRTLQSAMSPVFV